MISKTLKGFSGSAHSVGILDDGAIYVDVHWFDDDRGDSTSTYFVSPSSAMKIRKLLISDRSHINDDSYLLDVFANKFNDSLDVVKWLERSGIVMYKHVDSYANSSVPNTLPGWVLNMIAESEH